MFLAFLLVWLIFDAFLSEKDTSANILIILLVVFMLISLISKLIYP